MQVAQNILIVDDDADDYHIIRDYLLQIPENTFQITWAASFQQALELLHAQRFDICFFDYRLGLHTGLDLVQVAQQLKLRMPIILLTGKINQEIDQLAIRLGVSDYLEKSDIDAKKLERCIRYAFERSAVQMALQESEEKYRIIFAQSLDAFCLIDENGQFTDANTTALKLLGLGASEITDRKLSDFFFSEDKAAGFREKLRQNENIPEFEAGIRDAGGELHDCVLVCTCLHQPAEPTQVFFQCILRDVTRRKKMEQQILAAEKLAATGRLMRMLGHEIRNPLNNIDLAATQLAEESNDEERAYFIDIISRNSKRINQLLTALLHSTTNYGQLRLQPTAVAHLLAQVIEMANDRLALKEIQLKQTFDPGATLQISADNDKLVIALLNLVINAIEALEGRQGQIEIGTMVHADEVGLVFRDNGPGIPHEAQHQIFEPYFSQKTNGMGLGLAATLSIVQLHGGHIELNTSAEKGTAFVVWFPLL